MESTHTKKRSQRPTRAIAALTLLALTVTGGVAARVSQRSDPGIESSETLHFAAPEQGAVRFSGRLDRGSVLAGEDGTVKMELIMGAETRPSSQGARVPSDLLVILDRSGSMNGAPLRFAKDAVRELVDQLASDDRFALVTYASGANLTIPLGLATELAREGWLATLEALAARGGTHMARGIDLANEAVAQARESGRVARVILVSDGHANEGDHSHEGLRARASRAVAGEYVLSTVGVGAGFDENLMTSLADAGTGNFYYLHEARSLAGVFADEFASARETVASALEVSIEPAPGVQVEDAAGYPLERKGDRVLFRPGSLFSGQERRVWVTLRAPVSEAGAHELGRFTLSYRDGSAARHELAFREVPRVVCVDQMDEFVGSFDDDAWARSVIVDDYNALKQRVSGYVQAGKRKEALTEIETYRKSSEALNAHLERDDVAQQLGEAEGLAGSVRDAFVAGPKAQNELGKELAAEGRDGRRMGSKR